MCVSKYYKSLIIMHVYFCDPAFFLITWRNILDVISPVYKRKAKIRANINARNISIVLCGLKYHSMTKLLVILQALEPLQGGMVTSINEIYSP